MIPINFVPGTLLIAAALAFAIPQEPAGPPQEEEPAPIECEEVKTCYGGAQQAGTGALMVIVLGTNTDGECHCPEERGGEPGEEVECVLEKACKVDKTYSASIPAGGSGKLGRNGACQAGPVTIKIEIDITECEGSDAGVIQSWDNATCSGIADGSFGVSWYCTKDECSKGKC